MCIGIPAQVIAITDAANHLARVNVAGATREISLACVVDDVHPLEACVGAWVLVHMGFARAVVDEGEARRTLELLAALGSAAAAPVGAGP